MIDIVWDMETNDPDDFLTLLLLAGLQPSTNYGCLLRYFKVSRPVEALAAGTIVEVITYRRQCCYSATL